MTVSAKIPCGFFKPSVRKCLQVLCVVFVLFTVLLLFVLFLLVILLNRKPLLSLLESGLADTCYANHTHFYLPLSIGYGGEVIVVCDSLSAPAMAALTFMLPESLDDIDVDHDAAIFVLSLVDPLKKDNTSFHI